MPYFFKITLAFACLLCRHDSTIESVAESKTSDPEEAAQAATSVPLKCGACKKIAPLGSQIRVRVTPISAEQYADWIYDHQKTLPIQRNQQIKLAANEFLNVAHLEL
jgi:hypothetical protein